MWISMLSLTKKVLEEYKSLIVKMNYDLHTISYVKTTFEFLCNTLRLSWASLASCLCWKLQSMSLSSLLKVMRLLFVTLHESYKNVLFIFVYTFDCDSKKYIDLQFKKFTIFMDCTNDGLLIVWWNNPNTNIQYVIFQVNNIKSTTSAPQQGCLPCARMMNGTLFPRQ